LFTLPLDEVHINISVTPHHQERIISNWKEKTVLIAEDDDLNFRLICEGLKKTRIMIIRGKDGRETLDLFDRYSEQLDLVLMDIRMPEIDGYECTRIIKEKNPTMPVIAQTAYAMSAEREQTKDAGCDDYISKPMNMKDLIEKMSRFLK
jgi:two-component system, cell cycle response regulator DivK